MKDPGPERNHTIFDPVLWRLHMYQEQAYYKAKEFGFIINLTGRLKKMKDRPTLQTIPDPRFRSKQNTGDGIKPSCDS